MASTVPPAPYPPVDGTQPCALDPEAWFPDKGGSTADAKRMCTTCEIRRECLAYALTHEVDGVWGGTSVKERRALQRRHGIRPEPLQMPGAAQAPTTEPMEESA